MPEILKKISQSRHRILYGTSGLEHYRRFIRDQYEIMSQSNKSVWDSSVGDSAVKTKVNMEWYGEGVTFEEMKSHITQFKNPGLIEKVYNKVKDKLPDSVKSRLKEKKLNFNDRGFGTFSMDRFMMAMYKRPAFWSVKLQEYVKPGEVYEKAGKFYLKADNSDVEKHMKIATHNKKLYAHFPQLPKDNKAIEIVVTAGANANVEAEKMLYTGIAGIIMTELCERAGIKVRLNVFIGSREGSDITGAIIPMKDFNHPIDRNIIAMLTSDARVFRYEMFKGIIANYDSFGKQCPSSLGSLPSIDEVENVFESDQPIKNKVFKAKNVFYTSGLFNERAVINQIDKITNQLK